MAYHSEAEMQKNNILVRQTLRQSMGVMIVSGFAAFAGHLVDALVIARFMGPAAVAAYGFVGPIFLLASGISTILAVGTQNVCSKLMCAAKKDEAIDGFSAAYWILTLIGTVLMISLIAVPRPIAFVLGVKGDAAALMPMVREYLLGFSFGLPALLTLALLLPFMQLDNDRGRSLRATLLMTGTNVVGDLVVAAVNGGMLWMAVTTSVSHLVTLIYLMGHFHKKDTVYRIRPTLKTPHLKAILVNGLPGALLQLCKTLRIVIMNNILTIISTSAAVAALSAQNTVINGFGTVSAGIAMAVMMIASVYYGEKDRRSLEQLQVLGVRYSLIAGVIMGAVTALLARPLAILFLNGDPGVIQLGTEAIRFFALAFPLYSLNYMLLNYLQGIGNIRLASICIVLQSLVFVSAAAALLGHFLGTNGVWLSYLVSEVLLILVFYGYCYVKTGWFIPDRETLLFLPGRTKLGTGPQMERSIASVEELSILSEQAGQFCWDIGMDRKSCTMTALCIEEMASNIIQHGFEENRKNSIDVRLAQDKDGVIIRIRDNCKPFDPMKQLDLMSDEDPTRNIGIRTVFKAARDLQYTNTLSNNNLIIHIHRNKEKLDRYLI